MFVSLSQFSANSQLIGEEATMRHNQAMVRLPSLLLGLISGAQIWVVPMAVSGPTRWLIRSLSKRSSVEQRRWPP
jgi:hypothetical protein